MRSLLSLFVLCLFVGSALSACAGVPKSFNGKPCASTTRYWDDQMGACGYVATPIIHTIFLFSHHTLPFSSYRANIIVLDVEVAMPHFPGSGPTTLELAAPLSLDQAHGAEVDVVCTPATLLSLSSPFPTSSSIRKLMCSFRKVL